MPLTNVIIKIHLVLLFTLDNTKNIAYHITEVLIFYAVKLMVMGNSKNLRVFNLAILLKSCENLMLAKYTCFTVWKCGFSDQSATRLIYYANMLQCGSYQ